LAATKHLPPHRSQGEVSSEQQSFPQCREPARKEGKAAPKSHKVMAVAPEEHLSGWL
jgi:hypothetical protein